MVKSAKCSNLCFPQTVAEEIINLMWLRATEIRRRKIGQVTGVGENHLVRTCHCGSLKSLVFKKIAQLEFINYKCWLKSTTNFELCMIVFIVCIEQGSGQSFHRKKPFIRTVTKPQLVLCSAIGKENTPKYKKLNLNYIEYNNTKNGKLHGFIWLRSRWYTM